MSERKWAAANGQEITEEMVRRWCDAYERGEFPECERTVGGVAPTDARELAPTCWMCRYRARSTATTIESDRATKSV